MHAVFSHISSALPLVQRPWETDAAARLATDLAEQVFGRRMPHRVRLVSGGGDADRAEGAVVAAVKADDGDVLRHALSRAQKRPDQMEGDLVVVADDGRAAAQLLPEEPLQHALVLQLDKLMALEAGKPEKIFIGREQSRVAHRADDAVIALRALYIVGFEDPGDFPMPVPDQVPGQQIAAAVIVVADAERVGQLPAASVQKGQRRSAPLQFQIKLGVRARQRRLAALDQNARRGIEQQLLQDLALAADGVFRGVNDDGKALRGKTGLNVLEQRRENVVAERGRDHGDAPVLTGSRRAQKAFGEKPTLRYKSIRSAKAK